MHRSARAPLSIEFITRQNCPLCDEARALLLPMAEARGAVVTERDVDIDPALAGFTNRVPVVRAGGRVVAEGHIRSWRLRLALLAVRHR